MNNVENLVIDSYPKINIEMLILETEFYIDTEQEISISINNSIILDKEDILNINNNCIELAKEIELDKDDAIVIIYNRLYK